ncbi:MAG: hypothetical protein VB108_07390 [Anaerolineaceae bacterium]|nr:hypothetical protein [Anaerolineaceae bacterium]
MEKVRERLSLEAKALRHDRFEILAITVGAANGWQFPAQVLKQSLSLWDGVNCFIDHDMGSRSVRDVAGVLRNPNWDEGREGIRTELQAFGPSANLLREVGKQVLDEHDLPAVKLGFSADLLFNGKDRTVEKILKVFSVDLVYNPARGGIFLRALNQIGLKPYLQGGYAMQLCDLTETTAKEAAQTAQSAEDPVQVLQEELAEMRKTRKAMSTWMLEASLSASNLPKTMKERIQAQFQERDFAPAELQSALREARTLLAEIEHGKGVAGSPRIEGMVEPAERLQAAVDDLFGNPREERLRQVQAPRLSGIRELYLATTGDIEMHGGYHPERAQFANTGDFSGLVKNALNKIVVNTWDELGKAGYDWWKQVTVQEHFNTLNGITGTLVGTVGDLPAVAEGGSYTELLVGDSAETANFKKYGGYIPLTLELIDRDETRKLRSYARELASAGMRKISRLVAAIFTSANGVGNTLGDGGALFNNNAVSSSGGHSNLDALPLNAVNWDLVSSRVFKQPMLIKNVSGAYGSGPYMAVNPKYMLVPRGLQKTAMEICSGSFVREATYVYDNVLKGSAVPVVVPEWTDDNDWAAVCDPRIAPAIFVGERFGLAPEVFIAGDELSPAVFTNDEHRLKVRHFLAVWVNDFRPLYKCNVA